MEQLFNKLVELKIRTLHSPNYSPTTKRWIVAVTNKIADTLHNGNNYGLLMWLLRNKKKTISFLAMTPEQDTITAINEKLGGTFTLATSMMYHDVPLIISRIMLRILHWHIKNSTDCTTYKLNVTNIVGSVCVDLHKVLSKQQSFENNNKE